MYVLDFAGGGAVHLVGKQNILYIHVGLSIELHAYHCLMPNFAMVITQKIIVGISSNFLHSIRASICIRKYNKNWGYFWSHFLEKSMGYSTGYFSEFGPFLKMVIT